MGKISISKTKDKPRYVKPDTQNGKGNSHKVQEVQKIPRRINPWKNTLRHSFFPDTYETFSRTNWHMMGHNERLSKFKKIEIISRQHCEIGSQLSEKKLKNTQTHGD